MRHPHPLQQIVIDDDGRARFRGNAICRYLLALATQHGITLDKMRASEAFSDDDWEQFVQLIGYSVYAFGEVKFVSDKMYEKAQRAADRPVRLKP